MFQVLLKHHVFFLRNYANLADFDTFQNLFLRNRWAKLNQTLGSLLSKLCLTATPLSKIAAVTKKKKLLYLSFTALFAVKMSSNLPCS